MAYTSSYSWDSSYCDRRNSRGPWLHSSHSQQEQYNPVYPSFNGTSSFFSSSAQEYDAAPYNPTRTSISSSARPSISQRKQRNDRKQRVKKTLSSKFHLIAIDPSVPDSKPVISKISDSAPKTPIKVARGSISAVNSQRGKRGIRKMPNFRLQGNSWETNGLQNYPGNGGRRGGKVGGRGRGRGGFNRNGKFHGQPRPTNNKDDIQFVHLPDDFPAITLNVSSDNITAFHGFDSVFTTQHCFPVLIDNKIYTSCDHFYQICKVTDLTGISSDALNRGVRDESGKPIVDESDEKGKKAYSAIAKDMIKAANIGKDKVDEWRNTRGLVAIQKALHAKVTQSAHLREALKESGDHILVHAFARDSIYGTGCTIPAIKKWLDDLSKTGVKTLKIPATFPLDETTVQHCPVFAQGRNILGVILMQLREKIRNEEIQIVDMSRVYNALRVNNAPSEPMSTNMSSGFITDKKSVGTF